MARKPHVPRIGDTDLKLLRIFRSVVDSGGLAAAETELNIGRSTISKQIADLELRLGLRLCSRGPAGFSLTDEGEKVLEAANRLLTHVADFRVEVNEIRRDLVGVIRIALFDQCASNPEARLSPAIFRFNQAASDVEIDLSLEPPNLIETQLLGGELDLGIISDHNPSPSLDYQPIYGENMYLYCGRQHEFFDRDQRELTLDDVRRTNYAGISANSPNLHVGQTLGLRRAAKVQSEHALTILIMSGRFVGFLPDHLTNDFVANGLMKQILPEELHYRATFAATTRRTPKPNRITRLFLETLIAEHNKVSQGIRRAVAGHSSIG